MTHAIDEADSTIAGRRHVSAPALDERRTDVLSFGADEVLDVFARLVTIRVFEERVEEAHKAGRLYGPFHSSIGQEAVAVGVCTALAPQDVVTSTHRGHGHVIAKGGDLAKMCAELWGAPTATTGARADRCTSPRRSSA